jgi:hypothetical protein
MAVTFGLDISHHQDLRLDLAQCRREGIEFVILKATEGAGWNDPEFAANVNEARAAGLLVAVYHYQRSNATAAAQIANVRDSVPLDVPVVLDVETNSGGVALTRDIVSGLRAAGYRVPLTYIPRWYWQQLGAPSLAGLPPLWSSRYPDNIVGSIADEWADVPAHYWNGYGGLDAAVLQFTSSVRIAGDQPIDANAYRGSRDQLAALLGYTTPREDPMRDLILAREANGPKTWVGDGLLRRHVADPNELGGLQYWIGQKGGDSEVKAPWQDLRVLGVDLVALVRQTVIDVLGQLGDDETNIVNAVRDIVTSDPDAVVELKPEHVDQFAAQVLAKLPEHVREAVRQAFARAGQSEGAPSV